MVQAIHFSVSGRVRYKVLGLSGSEPLKNAIHSGLIARPGIKSVSASIVTGNVLVRYNSDNTRLGIASFIKNIVIEYRSSGPDKGSAPVQAASLLSKPEKPHKAGRPRLIDGGNPVSDQGRKKEAWHLLAPLDALKAFSVSEDFGLATLEARANLDKYGANLLPEAEPRSGLSIFLNQFNSLPVLLLGAAAGVSLLTGGVSDAVVIVAVMGINAAIGYVTESRAEKTISSLKSFIRPAANVLRDGSVKEVPAHEVVPGDVLALRAGTYIAADARIIEAQRLSVDESSLTGESLPVAKQADSLFERDVPLGDRTNMVYMGTLVTGGQGLAIVVATGGLTEISMIQALVAYTEPPETPMQRQLGRMGIQLVLISGAVCCVVFVIGLVRGYGFLQMLKTSISLAVAAVPEGLPTIATTTLALGISSMRRRRVLIRRLDAVETLGSVQTICMDKTGTITVNRMTVVAICAGLRLYKVSEDGFTEGARKVDPFECDELLRLIHVAVLCNESEAAYNGDGYTVNGSPTENSLIYMAISAGVEATALRQRYPVYRTVYRAENRNHMATFHRLSGKGRLVAMKGSPSEVLSMCSHFIKDGMALSLGDGDRLSIETANERMAGDALRVLGAAYLIDERDDALVEGSMVWLGLIGMADPVRKGIKESVKAFHAAGIDTVMITGDQSPTAYSIGRELNLSGNGQIEILDSTHLTDVSPELLSALSRRVNVFSRVSPANKLQIVQSLQKAGRVVAMTGDGINDSPALRAADIGIAMGHTGTDVAREVADVILEDDDIETMIIAISQGRTIYGNIRKSVHFLLSTNLSEILVMFTCIAGGLGTPLSAMQLLWINLVSDIAPGLALALEPPEPDVLSRPPRDPSEPIIKGSDFKRIFSESAAISTGALASYVYGISRYGRGPAAGTLAFMSLTSAQILHSLSCRSERRVFGRGLPPNRYLDFAVGGSFALQALTLLVPGLRGLLGLTAVSALDMAVVGGSAILPLAFNEMTKEERA